MSVSATKINCELRTVVGSRASRRLRYEGRMVGCIQSVDGSPHIDLHFDAREFETARRHHVHVFDLALGAKVQSAVVNSLQWDSLGDTLVHVEFLPVDKTRAMDSKVEIHFVGTAVGVVQHILDEVMVRCLPTHIPDFLVAKVDGLTDGTHIRAKDLVLPEGVALAIDPMTEIAVVSAKKAEAAPPPPAEGEAPAAPAKA